MSETEPQTALRRLLALKKYVWNDEDAEVTLPGDRTEEEVAGDEFIESEHPRDDEEKTHHLRENDPGGVQITDPDDLDDPKVAALTAKRDKALADGKEKLANAIGAVIEKLRETE
jgi:hypothetical protein